MPYLISDIVGTSSRIDYGRQGDLVTIYSDHDNVFIVENSQGFRFAVRKDFLSDKIIQPSETPTLVLSKKKKK